MSGIEKDVKDSVLNHCNRGLVPDAQYDPTTEYPISWFTRYFSFLEDETLEKHLGEAFYQARFCYKLMETLSLPVAKHKAFVSIQIIQYASICEAVLQKCIEHFYKEMFQQQYAVKQFQKNQNALSVDTVIMNGSKQLFLCNEKTIKADIKRERMDHKTQFAVENGIISSDTKQKFDLLYDARNNVHILKATQNNYIPRKREAKEAFELMQQFVSEIKLFFENHSN